MNLHPQKPIVLGTILTTLALVQGCGGGNSFCDKLQVETTPNAAYQGATVVAGNSLTVKPTVGLNGPIVSATLASGTLPPGLSLAADGSVTGTPTTPGTYTLTVTLCNALGGCTTVTDTITVLPGASYDPQTTTVGTSLTVVPVRATAETITSATLVGGSLPAGMTLQSDGSITGVPTTPGVYSASVQTCTASGCSTATSVITVNAAAALPLAAAYTSVAGPVNQALATAPTVTTGGPVTAATVAQGSLPAGMTLHADGTIDGTPTQSGTYPLLVTLANASGGQVTVPVVLTVTAAGAVALNASYTPITIRVGGSLADLPDVLAGEPVTQAAFVGGTLPPGTSLDPATGQIYGTPTTAGTYTAQITLRNASGGAVTVPAVITVNAGAQALDAAYADAVAPVGSYLSVSPTVILGGPISSAALVSGSLPPGLTLNADGTITGVPTQEGTYTLEIQVCNGNGGCETIPFTLTVTQGKPALSYVSPTTTVGTALVMTPVNGGGDFVSPVQLVSGSLPAGMSLDPATGIISGTPTAAGVFPIQVQACNASGCTTTSAVITVNDAALHPLDAAYADASGTVGTALNVAPVATLDGPVSSAALAGGTLPPGMTLDTATGIVSGTPTAAGSYPLLVTLGNAAGAKVTVPVTLTISQAGATALAASYTGATIPVNTAFTTVPAVQSGSPVTSATLAGGTLPPGMSIVPGTGAITGTPTATGTYTASILLANASGGSVTAPVTITVTDSQVAALTATYSNAVIAQGAALGSPIAPTVSGTVSSAEVVSGSLPPGLSLNSDGTITGTPTALGVYTLQIRLCSDSGACTVAPLVITVDALALHYTTPVVYTTGTAISDNVPNPTGTPTAYSLTGTLPAGLHLDTTTGHISGTPTAATGGAVTVTITGTAGGTSASQPVAITVVDAPTASLTANPSTVPVGQTSSLTVLFAGSADGTAVLSGGNLAAPLQVTTGNSISVPAEASPTTQTYTLTVTNAAGLQVQSSCTVTWTPLPVNQMTFTLPSSGTSAENTDPSSPLYGFKVTAPDQGESACGDVQVTVVDEGTALPTGAVVPSGVSQLSDVVNVTTNMGYPFRQPLTFSLPYSATGLASTDVPVPFYWDETYHCWVAAGLKGLGTFSSGTGTRAAFTSLLPGRYVVMAIPNLLSSLIAVDSGFLASTDALSMGNQGDYGNPGGSSLGVSAFQAWYQGIRDGKNGHADLTSLLPSDSNQLALISRLANGTLSSWNQVWNQAAYTLTGQQTGLALVTALKVTGQPQILVMNDAGHADSAVAALVTMFDGAGTFTVADPNYPADQVTLAWASGTGAFSSYTRAAGYTPTMAAYAFEGQTTVHRLSDYEIVLQGAKTGWVNPPFATVSVTDVDGLGSVSSNGSLTINDATSVPLTYSVTNGSETAASMLVSQNGGTRVAAPLTGTTVNLADPYSTTIMLETTQDPCDPTFSHSGFMSFALKQAGLPAFFQDLCFESDTLAAPPASPWVNSCWFETDNLTGGTITSRAGTWSAVVAAGTDTNVSNSTFTLNMAFGGSQALRVNAAVRGLDYNKTAAPVSQVYQDAIVPNVAGANPKLVFYWAACLEDNGHTPVQQPFVDIQVAVQTGSDAGTVLFTKHFYANDPAYTGWVTPGTNGPGNAPWRVIPWQKATVSGLNSYKGETLRLTVKAGGCTPSGHAGYAYVDALNCE